MGHYALILVIIYTAMCVWLLFMQNRLLFPVPRPSYSEQMPHLQRISLADGTTTVIQYRPIAQARAVVIYTHGNAVDIGHLADRRAYFESQQIAVCLVEYPGYGCAGGTATPAQCYAAMDAAYAYIAKQVQTESASKPISIIVYGRSLGSGLAMYAASRYPCDGVIIESGYRSAQRVLLPIRLFPWDYFDNQALLPQVTAPILFIHGKQDPVVPFSHGAFMAANATHCFAQCWLPDAGHNDIYLSQPAVHQQLQKFILSLAPQEQ